MTIFTPNTVIKSADVNLNFDEVDGRLDDLESISPMVFALRPNGSGTTITAPATITGFTEKIDKGNNFNPSTGVFTCPKAGKYFVNFSGFTNTTAGGGGLWIYRNGLGEDRRVYCTSTATDYRPISTTAIVDCAINDTLTIYIDTNLVLHTNQGTLLTIYYLGL